jgi:hypothetical protein
MILCGQMHVTRRRVGAFDHKRSLERVGRVALRRRLAERRAMQRCVDPIV